MKNRIKVLITLFIALYSTLVSAEIREIKKMTEIIPSVDAKTLVVFDLDNTVIESRQTMGSDQFFGYLVEKAKGQGMNDQLAVTCALKNAALVQPTSAAVTVEPYTSKFIASLQYHRIAVIALTARPFEWARGTLSQLNSVGVDFRKTRVYSDAIRDDAFTARYLNGVLFMKNGQDKGVALRRFISQAHAQFGRVLFVDDKIKNVQNVENAFTGSNLEHIEFRYGAADSRVHAFNREVAEVEWNYFVNYGVFISDRNAMDILAAGTRIEPARLNCL